MSYPEYPFLHLPPELIALVQWLIWRFVYGEPGTRPDKRPYQCTGYGASIINPRHWSGYDYAMKTWVEQRVPCDGIGFVFTADDPYCGIDLDNVYPSDAAECSPLMARILERFSDTYSEVSPSGRGIKLWCKAKAPRSGKWAVGGGAIEVYDRGRFFTVTGRSNG